MKKVLFIGGPGNISGAAITDLLEKGFAVSLLTRSTDRDDDQVAQHCHIIQGNRNNPDEVRGAIRAVKPDAIVDVCAFSPGQLAPALPYIEGACAQYILVSTCDVYGYPLARLPQRETDAFRPPNCRYAVDKLALETLAQDSLRHTALTIIRPAYSMGKRFALDCLSRNGGLELVARLRAGLPVISPDDGTKHLHASHAHDTGRMLARTVLCEKSYGKAYTCGARDSMAYDDYIRLFADALGVPPQIIHIPTDEIYALADYRIYEENLLNDLMRYDVRFSMEGFLADFPDFLWKNPVADAVKAYIEYQDTKRAFALPENSVQQGVLAGYTAK